MNPIVTGFIKRGLELGYSLEQIRKLAFLAGTNISLPNGTDLVPSPNVNTTNPVQSISPPPSWTSVPSTSVKAPNVKAPSIKAPNIPVTKSPAIPRVDMPKINLAKPNLVPGPNDVPRGIMPTQTRPNSNNYPMPEMLV